MSDKIVILSKRPAFVKEEIELALDGQTPLQKREDSRFGNYFEMIWRNLL